MSSDEFREFLEDSGIAREELFSLTKEFRVISARLSEDGCARFR
jgi:hypothetical protein